MHDNYEIKHLPCQGYLRLNPCTFFSTWSAAGTPFKPASVPRKGRQATFTKYPEYLHDPEVAKIEARTSERKKEREILGAHAGGAWRPGGQTKTDATRSIVRMNL